MIDIQRAIDYATQLIKDDDVSDLDVLNLAEAARLLAEFHNRCLDQHFHLEPLNLSNLISETDPLDY